MRTKDTTTERALAEKLCLAYAFQRRAHERMLTGRRSRYRVPPFWGGGAKAGPETTGTASVWLRLVRLCRSRGVDPARYVRWCLCANQLLMAKAPEPNQLLNGELVAAYLASEPKQQQIVTLALRTQRSIAEADFRYYQRFARMTPEDSYVSTLRDTTLDLSALFRYCVALLLARKANEPERFHSIADLFEAEALLQYEHDAPAYDASPWTELIPAGFRERAARVYDEIIRH